MKSKINILILLACLIIPLAAKADTDTQKITLECTNITEGKGYYYFNNAVFRAPGEWAVDNSKEATLRTTITGFSPSNAACPYFSFKEDGYTYVVVSYGGNKRTNTSMSMQVIIPKGLLYDPANPAIVNDQKSISFSGTNTKPNAITEEDKVNVDVCLNGHTITGSHLGGLKYTLTVKPATFFKTSAADLDGESILKAMTNKTYSATITDSARFDIETYEFTGIKTLPDASGLGSYTKCPVTVEATSGSLVFRGLTDGQIVTILDPAGEPLATRTYRTPASPSDPASPYDNGVTPGVITVRLPAGSYLAAVGTEHIPMTVD